MRRRNLADLGSALPLLVAAATALAAFGLLAAAGARSAPAAAPVQPPVRRPARAPIRRAPAGLVSRVGGVRLLPTRVSTVPGVSPALVWGGGRLWAPGAEGLERISPATLAASSSSRYYGTCADSEVAYGAGGIWVTEGDCGAGTGMVYEFDRRTRLRRLIRLPVAAVGKRPGWTGLGHHDGGSEQPPGGRAGRSGEREGDRGGRAVRRERRHRCQELVSE